MWCSLKIFLIIVIFSDPIMCSDDENFFDEQYCNHSLIQPRQTTSSGIVAASSITAATIQTPRFPNNYQTRTLLEWHFTITGEVEIYCPVFDLRPRKNGKCHDYLQIETENGEYVHIDWFCGDDLNGVTKVYKTNLLDLTFKSSRKTNRKFKGFNCTISPHITIQECNCGVYTPPLPPITGRNGKIVNGSETRDNQFPWQALTLRDFIPWCGGSIITDQFILTAAHCTEGLSVSDILVVLGAQCLSNPPPGMLVLSVVDIIEHDEYDPITYNNDIALLKLGTSIDFTNTQFRPICLPVDSNDPIPDQDDVEAVISGFGALASGGPHPNCLQYAIVPTMNNTYCESFYPGEITAKMICAGYPGVGGIDSCQGDSGGPMATNATSASGNYYVQIGVVSWGVGCAEPDFPGVYTRVTEYIDWINNNTADSSTCSPP